MTKSRMQKVAIACIAACAVLGGIETSNAQMRGGSHADGGGFHGGDGSHEGGFHGGDGSHEGGFHGGDGSHEGGFHGRDRSHDADRFRGRVFIGPPIIFGPGYDPYDYSYPYADDWSAYQQWYCRDPAGYYPDVQSCLSGWLQVMPNG